MPSLSRCLCVIQPSKMCVNSLSLSLTLTLGGWSQRPTSPTLVQQRLLGPIPKPPAPLAQRGWWGLPLRARPHPRLPRVRKQAPRKQAPTLDAGDVAGAEAAGAGVAIMYVFSFVRHRARAVAQRAPGRPKATARVAGARVGGHEAAGGGVGGGRGGEEEEEL